MNIRILSFLLIFSFSFISCDDDSEDIAGEPLLGIYTISKSVLTADATSQNGLVSIPAGTDVTAAIVTAFLSEIECKVQLIKQLKYQKIIKLILFVDLKISLKIKVHGQLMKPELNLLLHY